MMRAVAPSSMQKLCRNNDDEEGDSDIENGVPRECKGRGIVDLGLNEREMER